MIKEINSVSNPVIKETASLLQKKYRTRQKSFLLEGSKSIDAAIENGFLPRCLFIDKSCLSPDECRKYEEMAEQQETALYYVNDLIIRKISDTVSPQPVVAVFDSLDYRFSDIDQSDEALVIILDGVADPGNVGTIIRTADAAGANAVVLNQNCAELFAPKTLRSTMGSVFHLPVITGENDEKIFEWLKGENFTVITTAADADESLTTACLPLRSAVVLGSEAQGVSRFWQENAGKSIFIPMMGRAESLNVAVAAALLMYKKLLF